MSEWKETAAKRRDFRNLKGRPEIPKPGASKKKRPFLLWIKMKPEELHTRIEEGKARLRESPPGTTPHSFWGRLHFREWTVYGRYATRAGAEQAMKQYTNRPYYIIRYNFKIEDTSHTEE